MLAVASGLCRHVLCFRTVWESTYAAARPAAAGRRPGLGPDARVAGAVRRDVGGQLDRHERQPVPAPLRRQPGDARVDRPQRPGQRGPQPVGHLPRPDDDGRLPVGPPDHHARSASTTATSRATRRSPSSCPTRRSPATCPSPPSGSTPSAPRSLERISWDQDTDHPRAPGARPVGPPLDPDRPAPGRRRPRPRSTTASRSTPSPGSRRLGFCGLRRGPGLARRRPPHRPRRRAAGQPPRRPAVGGPHPRLRLPLRGR